MAKRIRIVMHWQIAMVPGLQGAPFSKIEDFRALARGQMVTRFSNYHPSLSINVLEDFQIGAILELTWDVDLDMVRGAWHQPEDHIEMAKYQLVAAISGYGRKLDVVDVLLHVGLEDAVDHTDILRHANSANIRTTAEDYPVYRTMPPRSWPGAVQVFLLDGLWWWQDPTTDQSPMVGPTPTHIFTPWGGDNNEKAAA